MKRALLFLGLSLPAVLGAVGCGYTKEEYQLQGDKLTRAEAKLRTADQRADEAVAELEVAKEQLGDLERKVRLLGVDLSAETKPTELAATIAERERALTEHRARLAKLGEVRARLAILKQRFVGLAEAGVVVAVRDNQIVVELPADALFDANKDKLKPNAKDVLTVVANVLADEPAIGGRKLQVTGHADNQPKRTRAAAMASSLARASAVLAFLTDEKGAALDRERFSVVGVGSERPLVNDSSEQAHKRNRRVEIALVPGAGEHIDLRALADVPTKPAAPLVPPPSPTTPDQPKPLTTKPETTKPTTNDPAKPAPKTEPAKPAPKPN